MSDNISDALGWFLVMASIASFTSGFSYAFLVPDAPDVRWWSRWALGVICMGFLYVGRIMKNLEK